MKKILLIIAAMTFAITPMFGQSEEKHSKAVDYTGTHEVDISVGLPTAWVLSPMIDMGVLMATFFKPDPVEPSGKYSVIPNLRAEYGYNVLNWLNVGMAVNYSSCTSSMNYLDTDQYAWTESLNMTTITAKVKFYWLNREWVRMYSAVGAGIGIVRTNSAAVDVEDAANFMQYAVFAPDLCLIGLTVGKKLYGRFEWGTLYGAGISLGIGYRF